MASGHRAPHRGHALLADEENARLEPRERVTRDLVLDAQDFQDFQDGFVATARLTIGERISTRDRLVPELLETPKTIVRSYRERVEAADPSRGPDESPA